MTLSIVEKHVTFKGDGELYVDFYDDKQDAINTGLEVQTGWVILDGKGCPAADSQDVYFNSREVVEDWLTLENKASHG